MSNLCFQGQAGGHKNSLKAKIIKDLFKRLNKKMYFCILHCNSLATVTAITIAAVKD